tara:strand:+ start:462 stop:1367 length:906 start_codon:yes stop_codon:yes gene_type:complete
MKSPVWFAKHRPNQFSQVVGQEIITAEMRMIGEGQSPMNHFLFHSPEAGTGKTTLAHLLAKELGYRLQIFNASSKKLRGIEFIEEYIIPISTSGRWETIILLDEADRLTIQAQDALKGVIENATCYFILTCNDLTKVSPWLQSRCQLRHFKPIDDASMKESLVRIAVAETLTIGGVHLDAIIRRHKGDLRNAIGCLQAYATFDSEELRDCFILSLGDNDYRPQTFLRMCVKASNLEEAHKIIDSMPMRTVIKQTLEYALESGVNADAKMKVIEASIVSERDVLMGVDESIVRWNYCRMLCE